MESEESGSDIVASETSSLASDVAGAIAPYQFEPTTSDEEDVDDMEAETDAQAVRVGNTSWYGLIMIHSNYHCLSFVYLFINIQRSLFIKHKD